MEDFIVLTSRWLAYFALTIVGMLLVIDLTTRAYTVGRFISRSLKGGSK